MLIIRLQRTGTKNRPSFRIVLAQAYRAAGKKVVEVLGHYHPARKDFAIKDQERLKYWLAQHVHLSPTVHNLLVEKKLLEGKKVKAWQPKKKEGAAASQSEASLAPEGREAPAPTPVQAAAAPVAASETPSETAPAA